MHEARVEWFAEEAFALLGTGRQIAPFSSQEPGFGLDEAYRISRRIRQLREGRGEVAVGRKIGFTNRTIWTEYQVFAPIWGPMYDRTVFDLESVADGFSVAHLAEPRIEPEIAFHFSQPPTPCMTERELLGCVDWLAHGFELVQSIFPGWKFRAEDTVAAYGLHGAYLIGPRHDVRSDAESWFGALCDFEVELRRNGEPASRGHSRNVLDGPLSALRHLNDLLSDDPEGTPIAAGEIITTGTLTAALPVHPGETWTTAIRGIDLAGLSVTIR